MPQADKATSIVSNNLSRNNYQEETRLDRGLQKPALELGNSLLQLAEQLHKLEADQLAPH